MSQTGIDSIIEAAAVAKPTFYRHFPSKDVLIIAWLQDPGTRWFDPVRARAEAQAATPDDLVARIFEGVAEWLEASDFVGCPYLNTSVEISDAGHAASRIIRGYLGEIGAYLEELVAATGHPEAPRLGRQLHALMAGSIALAAANRTTAYAFAARDAALQLIGVAVSRPVAADRSRPRRSGRGSAPSGAPDGREGRGPARGPSPRGR